MILEPLRQHSAPGCLSCQQFVRQMEICILPLAGRLRCVGVSGGLLEALHLFQFYPHIKNVIKQCYFIISDKEHEINVV